MSAQKLRLWDGDTFERGGRTFRVHFERDEFHGEPWKESDGHGIVSEWTTRAKRPGERVLATDRNRSMFYDVAGTMKKAREEGWDFPPYGGTAGERAARAVAHDFEFLRSWCSDDWEYCVVTVDLLDAEGEVIATDSLGGVESFNDYHMEAAVEMADEILRTQEHEEEEAAHWAARDVATVREVRP